jgi:thioredoxin reductase (NADPH)
VPNLAQFESAGISYWASAIEAKLCEGQEIALVGAGNSAGQATVFLAPQVKTLHLIVRGKGLEASMSKYLIDRIAALPNVMLHTGCEIVALAGDATTGLTGATFHYRAGGDTVERPLHHVFLFIGADPNASWLRGCVDIDNKGFIMTGGPCADGSARLPLETSLPGIFAIGDVRAGSTKRVAAAVGEGAAAVAQIHSVLGGIVSRA